MTLKVGALVRDVYTDKRGRVLVADEDTGRCTVQLPGYKMTGCMSWFMEVISE